MKPTALLIVCCLFGTVALGQKKTYQQLIHRYTANYFEVKRLFEQEKAGEAREQARLLRRARRKGLELPVFEENEEEAKFYQWQDWMLRHMDQNGNYDPARLPLELQRFARSAPEPTPPGGSARQAAGATWKELGPFEYPTREPISWKHGFAVGRVGTVGFHPTNANILYAGSPGRAGGNNGGLWKTTDGGKTWTPLWDQAPSMVVRAVAVSPQNPETVFAATQYYDPNRTAASPNTGSYGLYKTTDGGRSWGFKRFDILFDNNFLPPPANNIRIDPTNDQHVLVLTSRGVLYSDDGGNTWKKATLPISSQAADLWDIEFKPGAPATVYVSGSGRDQLLKSVDGGKTFTGIALPPAVEIGTAGRIEMAVTAAAPDNLYFITTMGTERHGGVYCYNTATTALRVLVGREKKFTPSQTDNDDKQLYYCLALAVSPADTNELHVGMVALMSTYDGGKTWEYRHSFNTAKLGDVHSDIAGLQFQSQTNRLFVASDGGLYGATGKKGAPFQFLDGIADTQIYFLATAESRPGVMVIGTQDNGSKVYDNGKWPQLNGGDGMTTIIDPDNADVIYSTAQNGYLLRFTDGGRGTVSASYITPAQVTDKNTSFYTPLDYHKGTKTLYLGSNSLWRKNERNYSSAWENVKTFNDGEVIEELRVAPSDEKTIYVRTYQFKDQKNLYRLYRTTDAGLTWEKLLGDDFDARLIELLVHPQTPSTLWAFQFSLKDYVYYLVKSVDGGKNWVAVNDNLPRLAGYALAYQDGTDDGIYAALDQGVYYRDNTMKQWVRHGQGLPNAAVYDLKIDYLAGKVVAGTHGRGVWTADLAVAVGQVTAAKTSKTEVCAGSPITVTYKAARGAVARQAYTLQLSDGAGSFQNPTELGSSTTGEATVTLSGSLSAGTNYRVRVLLNANLATADTTDAFTLKTKPQASLSGSAEVVFGNPTSLTLNFAGLGPWTYALTGDSLRTTTTTPVVTSIKPSQSATYSLTSVANSCGTGLVSGTASVTVIPTLAVDGFTTSTLCAGQSGTVTVRQGGRFNQSTGYLVQLSDPVGTFNNPVVVGSGAQSPLSFTLPVGQTEGQAYKLRVVGNVNEKLETTASDAFSVQVKPTATVSVVGDTTIYQTYETRLRLAFTGTTPYTFRLSDGVTGTTATSSYELTVKPQKTTVYTVLEVSNGCGTGKGIGAARVVVIPLLAVDPLADPLISVSPNPTTDRVRIETTLTGTVELVLLAGNGREMLRKTFQKKTELSLKDYPKGLYLYQLTALSGVYNGKLLVE